jgi:CheY-like chemotaxis protein
MDRHGGGLDVYSEGVGISGSIFSISLAAVVGRTAVSDLPMCAIGDTLDIELGDNIRTINDDINSNSSVAKENSCVMYENLPDVLLTSVSVNPHLRRILIADDAVSTRKMMCNALKKHVDEIAQAGDGLEAVQCVTDSIRDGRPFDVILLDSVMPNMSGVEACRIIRSMGYEGLIIAITGNILSEDVVDFKLAGVDELVSKPIQLDKLMNVIKDGSSKMVNEV